MTINKHESAERAERYAQHIVDLARAFHVQLNVEHSLRPHDSGAGILVSLEESLRRFLGLERTEEPNAPRFILIHPVIDETTYAVALHELGHCVDPVASCRNTQGSRTQRRLGALSTIRDVKLLWEEECAAWKWAEHYALEWTPVMESLRDLCLRHYQKTARRYGVEVQR